MMPETNDAIAQRRRLAQALMAQGTSAEPVGHWTQAAARVAQALSGSANMGYADTASKARETFDTQQAEAKQGAARAYSEGAMQREVQQKMQLAQQAGLQPGSPEFKQYVYGIKTAGSDGPSDTALIQNYKFRMSLPENERLEFDRVQRAEDWRDVGTGFQNVRTGQFVQKNLVDAEAQKELGQSIGSQAAAAGGDMDAADTALELVDSIRNDPNRGAGTSTLSPVGNLIPKTPGFAFEQKVQQAKSGAFLTAIQQLRGMGALSNAEGQTATAAVTRMTTALDDAAFEEALIDYEKIVERGRRKASRTMKERQRLLGQTGGQAAPEQTGGDGWEEIDGVRIRAKR